MVGFKKEGVGSSQVAANVIDFSLRRTLYLVDQYAKSLI